MKPEKTLHEHREKGMEAPDPEDSMPTEVIRLIRYHYGPKDPRYGVEQSREDQNGREKTYLIDHFYFYQSAKKHYDYTTRTSHLFAVNARNRIAVTEAERKMQNAHPFDIVMRVLDEQVADATDKCKNTTVPYPEDFRIESKLDAMVRGTTPVSPEQALSINIIARTVLTNLRKTIRDAVEDGETP